MTLAAPVSSPIQPLTTNSVPVVVLGTDAMLAVLPATPVQLAHACLKAGFVSVIPASWGDELIASASLRELAQRGPGPAIQCSCPVVAHRLLTVGGDLRPMMVSFVTPPVAVARYLRAISAPARPRITYVGNCAGAVDESIDVRMSPNALLELLAERQLSVDDQPRVFESVIPADRRRFRSQPGGIPAADVLWNEAGHRTLIEISGEDLTTELAQHLLSGANVLVDVAPRLGCACSGAAPDVSREEARVRVASVEPPRALGAVVDDAIPLDLRQPMPAAPRTPIDISAHAPVIGPQVVRDERDTPAGPTPRLTLPRTTVSADARPRSSPSSAYRPPVSVAPVRESGRVLPRAYVARRRSSPKGLPAVPEGERVSDASSPPVAEATELPSPESASRRPTAAKPPAVETPRGAMNAMTMRQVIVILVIAALVTSIASATIGVLIGRTIVERTPATAGVR